MDSQGSRKPSANLNIKYTYFDEDDLWSGILAAAALEVRSKSNKLKVYSLGRLVFGRDIILLIKYKVD